jgi:multidrug efflux pump subunit AcrA (membrane-fusion protein)
MSMNRNHMLRITSRAEKSLPSLRLGSGLLAVLATALLIGCRPQAGKSDATAPAAGQGLAVQVQAVEKGNIHNELSISGVVAPSQMVMAFSKVSGKVVENRVREGQSVSRDEVLALVNQDVPGQDYKNHEVKSPISGVIAKIMQDPGSMVSPSIPVAKVIDMDKVKVTVNVIESEIGAVRVGMPAEIAAPAYPDRKFRGTVSNILPTVDPLSHAAKVEVTIPNPGQSLKPGMSATAALQLGRHTDVVVIPRAAVIEKMGEKYVFLVSGDAARRSVIQTGFENAGQVEVLSGVQPGDKLIISELNVLKDGSRVRAGAAD